MSIIHPDIAQQLYLERAERLRAEAAAARLARLARPTVRRPRGRPVRRPWWYRLARGQRVASDTAS